LFTDEIIPGETVLEFPKEFFAQYLNYQQRLSIIKNITSDTELAALASKLEIKDEIPIVTIPLFNFFKDTCVVEFNANYSYKFSVGNIKAEHIPDGFVNSLLGWLMHFNLGDLETNQQGLIGFLASFCLEHNVAALPQPTGIGGLYLQAYKDTFGFKDPTGNSTPELNPKITRWLGYCQQVKKIVVSPVATESNHIAHYLIGPKPYSLDQYIRMQDKEKEDTEPDEDELNDKDKSKSETEEDDLEENQNDEDKEADDNPADTPDDNTETGDPESNDTELTPDDTTLNEEETADTSEDSGESDDFGVNTEEPESTDTDTDSELTEDVSDEDQDVNDVEGIELTLNQGDTLNSVLFRQELCRQIDQILENPPKQLDIDGLSLLKHIKTRWSYLLNVNSLCRILRSIKGLPIKINQVTLNTGNKEAENV
jgi:hypothetical protein